MAQRGQRVWLSMAPWVARHVSARDGAKQSRIAAFAALRALRLTHAKSARCSFAQCLP